jgi:hypothetical protein
MPAPLDAIRPLLIGFGREKPEFGSYAGQLVGCTQNDRLFCESQLFKRKFPRIGA